MAYRITNKDAYKSAAGIPVSVLCDRKRLLPGDSCIYKHGEEDYRDLDEAWENYQEKMQSTTEWEAENQEEQEEEFQ